MWLINISVKYNRTAFPSSPTGARFENRLAPAGVFDGHCRMHFFDSMKWGALVFCFGAWTPLHGAGAAPAWEPERTWVFAVGVLQFDNPKTTTYPDEGRVDAEMIAAMQKRGVPADHIVFLKNREATKENIVQKLGPFLQRAGNGDTLFFYYAGHGGRDYSDPARTCTFLTYDTKSRWNVSSVFDTVEKNFHGAQAIYAADCCHSGSLVLEAAAHKARAGVLASAHVSSTSTGQWTFTRCLVRMFQGDPVMDFDGDGQVTFAEAARYIEGEMAFGEGQHSAHGETGGFPASLRMAKTAGPHSPRMGEHVMGESRGKWWKATILAEKNGTCQVTWPGWDHSFDEWLPPARIRPFAPTMLPVGTAVQAKWQDDWYAGRVTKTEWGLHLIHYDGYPAGDDEWMGIDRLKATGQEKK